MLKKNLSPNVEKLPKMKPVVLGETADEFTPSSSPKDTRIDSSSKNSLGTSITRPNYVFQGWDGKFPTNINEQFQMYLAEYYSQEDQSKVENKSVFDDIFRNGFTSAGLEAVERNKKPIKGGITPVKKTTGVTGSPANPQRGDQTSPRGRTTAPARPESVLTDEQSELAAIVEKLPESLDLTKWDEMTAFQQKNALKNSGLTNEEQMKLLNAPTSIQTIATIQDIQTNRAQYGITQAAADNISSELLKIANARIGVSNRALPFASDFQRNLFLKQLDKEEQKLLESVGGQKEDENDTIPQDPLKNKLSMHEFPNGQIIVKKFAPLSMVAQFAKDLLKAYVGIQFILPSALELIPMKEFGKFIDQGTVSAGMTGNASIFYVAGKKGSMGLAMDSTGDVGALRTKGTYLGVPNAAITVFASVSNADRLRDLEGKAIEYGGSIGEILTIGADIAFFTDKSGKKKFAVDVALGFGYSQLPVEGHVGASETLSFEDQTGEDESLKIYNIYEAWEKYVREFLEW